MATASGVMGPKQTKGYFVVLSTISSHLQFSIAAGSGAGGSYAPATPTTPYSTIITTNTVLKDMGKTVVSTSHTFRKVQALVANGPSITALTAAQGLPFYIELNTGQSLNATAATQVAYMPGLF